MNVSRGIFVLGLLLAGCAPLSEQGWIRVTGAAVDSEGRTLKRCRLDMFDAATSVHMVGRGVEGRFDIQLYPGSEPANAYHVTVGCGGYADRRKLGPFDATGPEWKQRLDLGDIVFRRPPG